MGRQCARALTHKTERRRESRGKRRERAGFGLVSLEEGEVSRLVGVSGSTTTQASKHRIEGWVGRGVRGVMSQRSISLRQACPRQVKGKSKASNRIYVGDIRIRIFGRAILRCLI